MMISVKVAVERPRPARGAGGQRDIVAPPSASERGWGPASIKILVLVLLTTIHSTPGWTQSSNTRPGQTMVEMDPIRCWWRTSAGAVITGESFSVVLTCAVVETDSVQVVPD